MKHTKRILAVLLALVLALGLAMPAMAAVHVDDCAQPHSQSFTPSSGDPDSPLPRTPFAMLGFLLRGFVLRIARLFSVR